MGKPRLIILVRHAQSEGNKNREIHQTTPDHRVKLTQEGWRQAQEAGLKLRSLLRPDDTLHFFTSPYRRTRETTEGILSTLTSDEHSPSPFPRHTIKVYEEPRLREQDFGNFQPDSEEMSRMWHERAAYGHFFYRIPNGESAADAYDRVAGFNESLWRSFSEDDFASVCVLVTHGLMSRVFLMKWYHWSVEFFEDLRNVNHCEFIVMKKNADNGRYILQNKMRTWTEWKRERQAEAKATGNPIDPRISEGRSSPIPMRKQWGDARSGDEAEEMKQRLPQRQNTMDLFKEEEEEGEDADDEQQQQQQQQRSSSRTRGSTRGYDGGPDPSRKLSFRATRIKSPRVAALKAGRDGGGSESGASEDDDTEKEEGEETPTAKPGRSMAMALQGRLNETGKLQERRLSIQELRQKSMDQTAMAEVLGDQSENECEDSYRDKERREDEAEFRRIQEDEQSFRNTVR